MATVESTSTPIRQDVYPYFSAVENADIRWTIVAYFEQHFWKRAFLLFFFFSSICIDSNMTSDTDDNGKDRVRRRTRSSTRAEEITTSHQKQRRSQPDKP